jgi:hypothetical protein
MKQKSSEFGLSLAGFGLGLGTFVVDQAGLDLPACLLIVLGILAIGMIVGGAVVPWLGRKDAAETPEAPNNCRELLIWLGRYANRLAQNLENFPEYWWRAVGDKEFAGEVPGYGETTHQEAVELLLFKFAQFFSAACVYQDFCAGHKDQGAVKPYVEGVYDALEIGSNKLHRIGKLSTDGWGGSRARPLDEDSLKAVLEEDPRAFRSVRTLLLEAQPGTPARKSIEAAGKAARRAEIWLRANRHGP